MKRWAAGGLLWIYRVHRGGKKLIFTWTCWKHVAGTKSLINDLCYCRREIMPELMLKSRSLHQIGSLIMSEFAFRASKEEVARMNKLKRLIFSRSAAAVMSNAVRNETLMSRENEVRWRGIDLQRWLFGLSGGGSACEWSRGDGATEVTRWTG